MKLDDSKSLDFANGGYAEHVEDVAARFVIIPGDPEGIALDFDNDFWNLWESEGKAIFLNHSQMFGMKFEPRSSGAFQFESKSFDEQLGPWEQYLQLTRGGILDACVGPGFRYRGSNFAGTDQVYFLLNSLVEMISVCVERYQPLVESNQIDGPFATVLGLKSTRNSLLTGFAKGWASPTGSGFHGHGVRPIHDENVLLKLEHQQWPLTQDEQVQMAYKFGRMICNAWGIPQDRFLPPPNAK